MALTKIGIVYDKNTMVRIRTIVTDGDDIHIDLHKETLLEHEAFFDMPIEHFKACSYHPAHLSAGNHSLDSYLAYHAGIV